MRDFDLRLSPTIMNGRRLKDDFAVLWNSDQFGERRIGRIRLAGEANTAQGEVWAWHLQPPLPVPGYGNGRADSLDEAKAAFRGAFEKFYAETSTTEFAHGFSHQPQRP